MVLYGITAITLVEELCTAAPDFLAPFYTDYAAFDRLVDSSDRLMTLLLERGSERGYFPKPAKSLFVCYSPAQEERSKQTFE